MLKEAEQDPNYQEIITCIKYGKSRDDIRKMHVNHPCQELCHILPVIGTIEKGGRTLITVEGHRIVVPQQTQKYILENLHHGHLGEGTAFQLARSKYYRCGLKNSVRRICEGCITSIEFSPSKGSDSEQAEEQPKGLT